MKRKAFTIVELLVVLSIIAAIAAVLVPTIAARYSSAKGDIVSIANGETDVVVYSDGSLIAEGAGIDPTAYGPIASIGYSGGAVVVVVGQASSPSSSPDGD